MTTLIFSQQVDAVKELAAGARLLGADQVTFVSLNPLDALVKGVDRVVSIAIPGGVALEDAYETVQAYVDSVNPDTILFAPSRTLKIILGRVAAHAQTSVVTDVIEFLDNQAVNLYFGGIARKTQTVNGNLKIYSVSPGTFTDDGSTTEPSTEELAFIPSANSLTMVLQKALPKSDKDLHKCDLIIGVGRGFAQENELDLARDLVEKTGAGLACSRPLTEGVNWLPKELYIGVSGLMLKPKTYVAVGISGQMQHMIGVNSAETIIAINKDKNAPIFKSADYGIVGDLKQVLPVLTASL
jgi:electron transfer flavoprotein alpha subunit